MEAFLLDRAKVMAGYTDTKVSNHKGLHIVVLLTAAVGVQRGLNFDQGRAGDSIQIGSGTTTVLRYTSIEGVFRCCIGACLIGYLNIMCVLWDLIYCKCYCFNATWSVSSNGLVVVKYFRTFSG